MSTARSAKDIGRLHPDYKPPKKHLSVVPITIKLAPSELTARAKRLRDVHICQARENFQAFVEYCFVDPKTSEPLEVQWFHEEWAEALNTENRVIIVAPRNHGKTTMLIAYIVWRLGREPNLRVKIVCEDDRTAIKRLGMIKDTITGNERVKEVFPQLKPKEGGKWSETMITVEREIIDPEPSLEAKGVSSGVTGARVDLLIADDIVGRRNALTQPAERVKVKSAWNDDYINLCDPNDTQIIYICTLWHRDDLSHELIKSGAYKLLFYAIEDDFGSIWPDRWSEAALRERRSILSRAAWARGYKNQPQDELEKPIQEAWIEYEDITNLDISQLVFITSYDIATKLKDSNDYFASCTIAVNKLANKVYVIDAWHARLTPSKQETMIMREFNRYHPLMCRIEIVGQANLDQRLIEKHPMIAGAIDPVNPKAGKYERLMGETPLLENGNVVFAHHLDPDSEDFKPSRGSLVSELLDFPDKGTNIHDDIADAFSQAMEGARRYVLDNYEAYGHNEINIDVIDI
jgi:predicted phage terminase large subunit-like protein